MQLTAALDLNHVFFSSSSFISHLHNIFHCTNTFSPFCVFFFIGFFLWHFAAAPAQFSFRRSWKFHPNSPLRIRRILFHRAHSWAAARRSFRGCARRASQIIAWRRVSAWHGRGRLFFFQGWQTRWSSGGISFLFYNGVQQSKNGRLLRVRERAGDFFLLLFVCVASNCSLASKRFICRKVDLTCQQLEKICWNL